MVPRPRREGLRPPRGSRRARRRHWPPRSTATPGARTHRRVGARVAVPRGDRNYRSLNCRSTTVLGGCERAGLPRDASPSVAVPAQSLAKPASGAMADERARLRPADRDPDPGRDGVGLVRLVQPAARAQRHHAGARGARLLPLQLDHQPVVDLPGQPGHARHPRSRPHPGPAGEAVVRHPEAVRLAPDPFDRLRARTRQPRPVGRRRRVRVLHRHLQRRVLLPVEVLLLRRALLRGLGLPRRLHRPRRAEDASARDGPPQQERASGAAHRCRRDGPRASRTRRPRTGRAVGAHDLATGPARCRRRRLVHRARPHPGRVGRRSAQHRAAGPPGPFVRRRSHRLPGQPDGGRRRHSSRSHG